MDKIGFLTNLSTNSVALGVASICSILGFVITIYLMFKTHGISKELKRISVAKEYNRRRKSFADQFEGHRKSISESGIHTRQIIDDIYSVLQAYKQQFSAILTAQDKLNIFCFEKLLKQDHSKIQFDKVCHHLSNLTGRLSKKEDV